MKRIEYFVPGVGGEEKGIATRLRWPIPAGVTQTYVEAYSEPGAPILVPYCQGHAAVQEALAAGRRALAVHFDPTVMLVVEAELKPLPARQVDAAVARLGDSLKQGIPLRRYLEDLYATTCPACLRPAIADYFVWDREQDTPVAKYLECPACRWSGQTTVDPEDQERLTQIPAGKMHHHYVLDRIVPRAHEELLRTRLEPLLGLYTLRNLYALAELTLRIESLFLKEPPRRALDTLLLDCLDRCSSLTPLPPRKTQRRRLSRPRRFLERNVWRAFEEAIPRWQASTVALDSAQAKPQAQTIDEFQAPGAEWDSYVGQGLVRDLARALPPRSVPLILVSPPALDSASWTLSYFWGAWLLGAEAVDPLRPLLRQRTPDATWYAKVMAGSFRNLAGLLSGQGRLVLVLTGQRPAMLEALLLAASRARLGLANLVQSAGDLRLEFTPSQPKAVPSSRLPLETQIQATAIDAAIETIRVRAEPVPWLTLHAGIQRRLAEADLLTRVLGSESPDSSPFDLIAEQVQAGLESGALVQLPGANADNVWWWLLQPTDLNPALSDRVETAAHEMLSDTLAATGADLTRALYQRFPGNLTPEAGLVAACLKSYGREVTPGNWQLRPEDLPDTRNAEREVIIEDLLALGKRLGYRAARGDTFDAVWYVREQARAVFVVRWQAAAGVTAALSDQIQGAQPYLVIPGGRSALVSYKLANNPVWQAIVEEMGWHFIKYRHVRELLAQPEVDEYTLQTIVGLDPIVEQEAAQLPLF